MEAFIIYSFLNSLLWTSFILPKLRSWGQTGFCWVCEGKEGLFGTCIISRDADWPAACNCAWPLSRRSRGLLNCGSMPRTCYTGLRVVLCLSMDEKMDHVQIDCLVCLQLRLCRWRACPNGHRVTPLSFCTFCLSCVLSQFFCSLGIFQVRACSHSQAQVTQNINSPSNCMSRGWGVGLTSTTRLRQLHLGLQPPLWKWVWEAWLLSGNSSSGEPILLTGVN